MSDQVRPGVEGATALDAEALTTALSEQHRGRLLLFAARRLRGDRAAAEDVVQEAFRTALEALRSGRIREPNALPAFAFETVRNLCMHRGRSAGREASALDRYAVQPATPPDDALTNVIRDERRRAVRLALERLEPEDRRVLELTYGELKTSEAIGQELGLSAGAVRARRLRALQKLTAVLDVTVFQPAGTKVGANGD